MAGSGECSIQCSSDSRSEFSEVLGTASGLAIAGDSVSEVICAVFL